jgi:primosomal protein N' (replication factor Y) (superfamily II helicase)
MIARVVIVPAAGDTGVLDYALGPAVAATVRPGMRVLVPLGARRAVGVVIELAGASRHAKLKPIAAVLDPQPLLDDSLLQLCRWIAGYYLCSLGEALSTALPGSLRVSLDRMVSLVSSAPDQVANGAEPADAAAPSLRPAEEALVTWLSAHGPQSVEAIVQTLGAAARRAITALHRKGRLSVVDQLRGEPLTKHDRYYAAVREPDPSEATLLRRRPAQQAIYTYLRRHPLGRARMRELAATFPGVAAKLGTLVKSRLVTMAEEEVYRPALRAALIPDHPVQLTAAQQEAVKAVESSIGKTFRPLLLWGVTGSGKTEVYLRCIASCLSIGRTALVLVPEISLTHQLVDRVRARFGDRVAVLHSGLSDGERWDEWRKIARGEMPIVVGARSAVFAPLPRLGFVVIDEEHDPAFKQEDGIRYNGRDVAVMRAKLAGCPVLLGSATPAMETFYNGRRGRYGVLSLADRVEARPLPSVDIVDLRRSPAGGKSLLISPKLAAALQANLAARGQSLIFLNRRGFSNFLQCHACGEALACPNCSVTLTLHRRWNALRCHHCDYTIPPPTACPGCGGASLSAWGAGTEQVEAALRTLLPGARIGRMDRDTTARKGSQRDIFMKWERRELDVLVGTQMITKGHDIPGVTLVGVLLADLSLNLPDFRAAERTFQLITQVAGRAGRGTQPGRVIVQTLQPQHVSLQCSMHHDFLRFAEHELAARRELGYPPFARLVQVRCEGEQLERTERIARVFAGEVSRVAPAGVGVLGPAPAPLERLRGRHRWHLLVRGRNGASVRQAVHAAHATVRRQARAAAVRVLVDIDPYNML